MISNMKIGTRLALAFTVVLLITLAISILSYVRMGLMNHNTDKIIVDLFPDTEVAHDIINDVNQISLGIRNTLLFVDTDMINAEVNRIHDTQKNTNELIEKLASPRLSGTGDIMMVLWGSRRAKSPWRIALPEVRIMCGFSGLSVNRACLPWTAIPSE